MRKTFKYRLYPSKAQQQALRGQFSEACRLYNAALQERIAAYRTHRKSINYYHQAAQLTEIRKAGDLGLPNRHCAQDVLKRLEKAFKAFFQRIKRKQQRQVSLASSRTAVMAASRFLLMATATSCCPVVSCKCREWEPSRLNCTAHFAAKSRRCQSNANATTGTFASQ